MQGLVQAMQTQAHTQAALQAQLEAQKECPHCGKTLGGTECWMITGKCLKCGSSDYKIKDCPKTLAGSPVRSASPGGSGSGSSAS
ncbi:hypothetical protein Taro_040004 [Colocasia esculenta]|uniref:Uncharacterized protein n=1 Tax=Colocasia esculenta TaxID=4460 RepID=A0A843WT68_COLES|nr:hypothetical protein [Colocasia esculenta]